MASIAKRITDSGVRWDVVYRTPEGKQRRKTFTRHADAKRYAGAVEVDKSRGAWVDDRCPTTVAEFARTWAESRPRRRESTATRVDGVIRNHLADTRLGGRRLVDVRKGEVQAWVNDRAEHLAPSTLRYTVKLVRSMFGEAVHQGLIARSPAARVDVPTDDQRVSPRRKVKAEGERVVPLSVEQVRALAAKVSERHRALVLTQAGLGLRVGELLALRVGDVEFLRREVAITQQLQPVTRERVPLKTRRSRRTVPLPRVVSEALAEHIAAYPPGEDGSIFTGETTGRPYAREVYYRAFAKAARQAGLPDGTTSQALRHHYVSVLLDAGESIVTVAERIGDSPAMVLDVYGHMMPDTEDRTRRAVDAAWEQAATSTVRGVTSV